MADIQVLSDFYLFFVCVYVFTHTAFNTRLRETRGMSAILHHSLTLKKTSGLYVHLFHKN